MCSGDDFVVQFTYDRLMPLEVPFEFARTDSYWREIHRCEKCGHFVEGFSLDQGALYSSDYVTSTYQDADGLKRSFDKIMALPPEKSDNAGRVECVLDYAMRHQSEGITQGKPTLLDVGSGLCVFAARMSEAGWDCTAIDLDERLVEHAIRVAKVSAQLGDVRTVANVSHFDAVTFNKVLEHIADPAAVLAAAHRLLKPGGFIYVEVPDGEAAAPYGREREEFLVGHLHVFSRNSLRLLIEKSGCRASEVEALREPSGKFTLRAFLDLSR